MNLILSIFTVGFCLLFPQVLANLFISNDAEVLAMTLTGLIIYSFGFLFLGYNLISTVALQSLAYSKEAFIFAITRGILLLIAFLYLNQAVFGVLGVWMAFGLTEAIAMIFMYFYFKRLSTSKDTS